MRNKKRLLAVTAGVALLAAGSAAGIATAAENSEPTPKALDYVDGLDDVTDDWNDHTEELGGSLCDGCDHSDGTDLVMMWQSVLAVHGFLPTDGIDGYFGPDTEEATMQWQQEQGVETTGEVDADTWAAASKNLEFLDSTTRIYRGADRSSIQFSGISDADGTYSMHYVYVADERFGVDGDKIELFDQTNELVELP